MNALRLLVAAAGLPTVLAAQVTMSWSMPAPLTATTVVAGNPDVHTNGALPAFVQSSQTVGAESASAIVSAAANQAAIGISFGVEHRLDVATASAPASSATASTDVLLQIVSTLPESAAIQINSTLLATVGATAPSLRVDLDDDGTFEWISGPANPSATFARVLGPVPLLVRVRADSVLAIAGSLQTGLQVAITPSHPTTTDIVMVGCSVPHHLYAQRAWGGGLEFGLFGQPATGPVVLALGLGVAPFVLPSLAPTPCVILPTPDFLFVLPPWPNGFPLPLPPSVRPVTFWAQAVPILPTGFEATGVWRIQAN